MMNATIIGNFQFGYNISGGQSIKTNMIYNSLKKYSKQLLSVVDTQNWKKKPFKMLKCCVKSAQNSKNIIILPAHNGIKVFAPLFILLKRKYKYKLHYIVIGGWLPEHAKRKHWLYNNLKKIDYIYVETKLMKRKLEKLGLENIVFMPNFKDLKIVNNVSPYVDEQLKICTFSRVVEKKGISDAINAVSKINKKGKIYHIDIYGLIDENYKKEFNKLLEKNREFAEYKGVIEQNKSTKILSRYYFLIFPTKFYSEGMPGTIIDAYCSGLPVISSSFENVNDVISNNVTGIIYKFNDFDDLYNTLEIASKSREIINAMKKNCIQEAEKYLPEKNINILLERMM